MGFYWTPTSQRIPWDRDGSICNAITVAGVVTRQTQQMINVLNSEIGSADTSNTVNPATYRSIAVIFPFPRDMTALYQWRNGTGASQWNWQMSQDTTNGIDGTWTDFGISATASATKPSYRDTAYITQLVVASSTLNVRGVRLYYTPGASDITWALKTLHLYGNASSGATNERVAFWDPTLDQPLGNGVWDFGDVPRSSTADKTFRVKNLSSVKTANSIALQPEVPTDTSPTVLSQMSIGVGGSFNTSQTISSLAPGAISAVYTLRRTTGSTAALSVWSGRVNANVSSWT